MSAKRVVRVESKKTVQQNEPSTTLVGLPCSKCKEDCVGGFMPYLWRKKCITCGCSRDCHQPLNKCDFPYLKEDKHVSVKYSWHPSGIDSDLVEAYMSSLPKNCQPLKGSKAERQREDNFKYQHPLQDVNADFCHKLSDLEKKRLIKFGERRIRDCFGVGKVFIMSDADKLSKCHGCSGSISPNSVVITTEKRMDENNLWHPQCFRCNTCLELLVDLLYFCSIEKNEVYCGRHHGETVVPRCNGCDELIFSGTYTEAKGKNWHKHHFCCASCGKELHGQKFDEGNEKILCEACYSKEAAHTCEKCRNIIGFGTKIISVKGKYWHGECFVCKRCKESVLGKRYYTNDKDLFCLECQTDHSTVAQCQGCKSAISSTTAFIRQKNNCWHAECFKCTVCQAFLASGKYHEVDDNPMCADCYITKASRKCANCQEPITTKGVQYGLANYHQDCFNCSSCGVNMITENKVKEKNGKLFCYNCYLKLAKKCFRCNGPITSRHTLYKGQPFHIECFKCNLCGSNIEGTEFYETNLNEIFCTKCAHIK